MDCKVLARPCDCLEWIPAGELEEMSDIYGKTVTEYALERRISELERENYLLKMNQPPSVRFLAEGPPDPKSVILTLPVPRTLHIAAQASAEWQDGMQGWQVRGSTSDGLHVAFYMDDAMLRSTNRYTRADILQSILTDVAQSLAGEVAKSVA